MTTTGTGAVEGCMQAFAALGPGLILENGFFGARWVDQAKQNGFDHHALSSPSDSCQMESGSNVGRISWTSRSYSGLIS